MTTVLTLEPLSGNWALLVGPGGTMKRNFGGAGLPWLAWEGLTTCEWLGLPVGTMVRRVPYPASLSPRSINDGVRALSTAIANTTDKMLVFAHSQGAQVVSRWLRERADADPGRVQFLLIGNPLRKYGGYGVGRPEVDGRKGLPTPTDTPYRVMDVKLQYDGWADWPDLTNAYAIQNANRDRIGINGPKAIHCYGYRTARLDDPRQKSYREQGTQFVMLPHRPLLDIDPALIEAGYRRPEDRSA
jgi:hypothetical protein